MRTHSRVRDSSLLWKKPGDGASARAAMMERKASSAIVTGSTRSPLLFLGRAGELAPQHLRPRPGVEGELGELAVEVLGEVLLGGLLADLLAFLPDQAVER